jgi:electron transport complex protein RnfG
MGKKVDESRLPPNPILDQFNGHVAVKGESWALPWKVKKDGGSVNYITGATISSRAVTDVTYRIARTFELKKKEIISGLAPASAGGEK